MKHLFLALLVLVSVIGGAFGYLHWQLDRLETFCGSLPQGWGAAQVREAAEEQGFRSAMEPYTQMRITPALYDPSERSCRVFFNRERVVEFKQFH